MKILSSETSSYGSLFCLVAIDEEYKYHVLLKKPTVDWERRVLEIAEEEHKKYLSDKTRYMLSKV